MGHIRITLEGEERGNSCFIFDDKGNKKIQRQLTALASLIEETPTSDPAELPKQKFGLYTLEVFRSSGEGRLMCRLTNTDIPREMKGRSIDFDVRDLGMFAEPVVSCAEHYRKHAG